VFELCQVPPMLLGDWHGALRKPEAMRVKLIEHYDTLKLLTRMNRLAVSHSTGYMSLFCWGPNLSVRLFKGIIP
jgi:hypothetical protein